MYKGRKDIFTNVGEVMKVKSESLFINLWTNEPGDW